MRKIVPVMIGFAIVTMSAVSIVMGSSVDGINPPGESVGALKHVDGASAIVEHVEPSDAYQALRRMLSVRAQASDRRYMVPRPDKDPHPVTPKAPATRRIAMIGAVTGGDGAVTYWFRDLDGTAIHPLVPGGDEVDGWQLVSIGKGIAVLSIEGETFHVKEK